MKKIINKRLKFLILIMILFFIINVAISLSYLTGTISNTESVSTIAFKAGSLDIVYSSNSSDITASNISPGYETTKQFTISSDFGDNHNYYNYGVWYKIALVIEQNEFDDDSISYSLTNDENSANDGITAINVFDIGVKNGQNISGLQIGNGAFFNNHVSHVYNLKITYNEKNVDQSHEIGNVFKAHISIQVPELISLTFDLDGGSFENDSLYNNSLEVPVNSTINLPTPTKDGYAFTGWKVVSGNVSTNGDVISTADNDITLKTLWRKTIFNFEYTGGEQEFIAEVPGYYKIETWGAQGGSVDNSNIGGYGGYSSGVIRFDVNQNLFINVGGSGINSMSNTAGYLNGGYNGGGRLYTISSSCNNKAGSGGGATHMAFVQGLLPSINSQNLLIVSSGGGGALTRYCGSGDQVYASGGSGGGYIGNSSIMNINSWAYTLSTGGSQVSGGVSGTTRDEGGTAHGSFGQGGSSSRTGGYTNSSGGGGGYYGGAGGIFVGGGGGSGYIGNSLLTDKYMYCYNCSTSDVESTKTYTTTCAEETPTENCAKIGNGYARITYLHE